MHSATQHLIDQFQFEYLPGPLQDVSRPIGELAATMVAELQEGPELSTGLRKLLEAKDCLVRQRVIDLKAAGAPAPVNSPEPVLNNLELEL